ncbi:Solute carrier family 40 member 1 [Coccomyxa sp. Obi]|nr:Solute carrier family 40 member 1 [Coccomyxa sp. Obi]
MSDPQHENEDQPLLAEIALQHESEVVESRSSTRSVQPAPADSATVLHLDTENDSSRALKYQTGDISRAKLALYGSHFLSTWGQRMWEFAIGLILLELRPGSLALVSVFGLVDSGAQVLAGPHIGAYIDRTPRLAAACSMYILQNSAVALSASSAMVASLPGTGEALFWTCILLTIGVGSASSVGCQGSALSVEREWTKALCQGDSGALALLNAGMRRIDLTCLIASPIMAGLLLTYGNLQIAIIAIVAWNLCAWLPECWLLRRAQNSFTALREQDLMESSSTPAGQSTETVLKKSISAGRTYARQDVVLAAVALALLYFTVMSFGLLMTAYLKWRGLPETVLSMYRGAGAVSGIASTLVFPALRKKFGLARAGALGICCQLGSLLAAVVGSGRVWSAAATHVLAAGLVASRFGLWTFDLCVSQLLQERVATLELGVVNGVQSSLQNLLQSFSYIVGLIVWQPEKFEWLMAGSVGMVFVAALLYCCFVVREMVFVL